ncbi:MAG TPA: MerR family transcriptional regulator [Acidimicrobiales bacterium]
MSESTGTSVESFSGKRAAEIVGISYRQLDYWARTNLIRPSLADANGSGSRRRYSYRDLIELKLIKTLLDSGTKLENIRQAFAYVRDQLGDDLTSAKLVLSGSSAVLVRENDELIDVLSKTKGQGVLNLLDLGDVKEEVDDAIIELFPEQQPAKPTRRVATG